MIDSKMLADAEFAAMQSLYGALEPLPDDARSRVLNYIVDRLRISIRNSSGVRDNFDSNIAIEEESIIEENITNLKYTTIAELFDAADPKVNSEKALVAGYWLQVCQKNESFDGQSVNKELKNLGYGLANITNAIDGLKNQKPALALQLKKSGTSQQARKVYKITVAGIKAVENMIGG